MIGLRCVSALAIAALNCPLAWSAQVDVWIGTTKHPNAASRGIYHCLFDTDSGRLTKPTLAAELGSPGFLTLHPHKPVLYATGRQSGVDSLSAYRMQTDTEEASLKLINSQPIGDGTAAHLATDRSGRYLFSAQYGGGSVALFPTEQDGSIGKRQQLIDHRGGSKVVANRQDSPHPHWVGVSSDNRFLFVPDLGKDCVVSYRFDETLGTLTSHQEANVPPGAGPRHMKFHPNGRIAYVLNELQLSITVFRYDSKAGTLEELQTVPTLSEAEKANERFNSGSEIRVHPKGKYVYSANRGHDSISVFRVVAGGQLEFVETEPIRGSWPRNFEVDSSGKWLLAAGRDSNTLSVFAIDLGSGELQYTLHSVNVPNPICVLVGAAK